MGYTALNDAIRGEFGTLIEDAQSLKTIYDNMPDPEPGSVDLWARVTVRVADSQQVTLGGGAKTHRRAGIVFVQLFGRKERGDGPLVAMADAIDAAFRSRSVAVSGGPTITYRSPRLGDALSDQAWFQRNVEIPFFADEVL